jgi:hypothetical protein
MAQYPLQPSFARGELSPRLHARVDVEHYKSSVAECFNFLVLRQGILRRRPGTQYIATTKFSTGNVRVVEFIFSVVQSYVLELGELYVRFYANGGQVQSGGGAYEIVSPWAAADVRDLQFVQEGDVVYVTHKNYSPRKIQRFGETNWTISTVVFEDGPYQDIVKDGTTMTPNGVGNIIPVMTTNTAPSGTASASANASGISPYMAFDANPGTEWRALTDGAAWLQYAFGAARVADGYFLQASGTSLTVGVGSSAAYIVPGHLRAPRSWTIEGSNDGFATSVVLDQRAGETGWGDLERRYYTFVNKTPYLAYRLNITDTNESESAEAPVSVTAWGLSGGDGDRSTIRLTLSSIASITHGDGFTSADIGRHVRLLSEDVYWHWFKITAIVSSSVVDAELYSPPLPSVKGASSWRLGAFSGASGWPACVALFQERLFYARTDAQPQSFWGSKTGSFEDFGVSIPLKPDDSISLTINDVGEITWIAESGDLLIGTISNVRPVGPADKNAGFSATNVQQGRKVRTGATPIRPAAAGEAHIFVGHYGNSLHELAFSFDANGYVAPDVSVLSEHLFKYGVRGLSYAQKPNALLWTEISDGTLVGMTYEREQKMVAMHRHAFGGDGNVVSQCVIPGAARDELWMIVERGSLRTIERMAADYEAADPENAAADQASAFYVDCGLTYNGAPTTTVSGLAHLNGKQVAIYADGAAEPLATVSGGSVTLASGLPASIIHVGLPYTSRIRTLPIANQSQDGSGVGRKKRIKKVILNLMQTAGLKVRGTGRPEEVILRSSNADMDKAEPLFTGNVTVRVDDRWENGGVLELEVSGPEPCTIRSITPAFESEP